MATNDKSGVRLSDSYIEERDRILKDLEAQIARADEVPWALRGLYRVGLSIAKIVVPPILGMFASTAKDVKEGIDAVTTGEALTIEIKRDDDWWIPVLKQFGFPDSTIKAIASIMPEIQTGPVMLRPLPGILMMVGLFGRLSAIVSGEPAKDLMRRYHPNVPSPGEILRTSFIDPSRHEAVVKALQQGGYTKEDIELMYVANYALYSEEHIRALFFRGALTEEQANNRLSEQGYTSTRIEELKQGWKVIPGIQDLVMMQAKEAFEPALIAKYGLGAEEPTDIYEWTRKLGLDDEWTQKYWSSHWQHASYAQVMEMLHRGYIDKDSVYDWYKLVEIPPYWRDLLTKIAYHPYTRVDVRRMHAQGVIGDDELITAMKDIGYDQEHAEKMADFYKKYNTRAEKDLSRADIEKAYEDGDLSEGDALYLLASIGYDAELSAFYLRRVDLEKERATRLERIDLCKEQFLSNLITEATARNNLVSYGLEIVRINELIYRWKIQVVKNMKLPSKTDLDKMLRNEIIIEDEYVEQMDKLGYRMQYIDWYLKLIYKGIEA